MYLGGVASTACDMHGNKVERKSFNPDLRVKQTCLHVRLTYGDKK